MAPLTRPATPPKTTDSDSSFFSQRARRQMSLFFAGAGFFAVTTLITRRALVRKYHATLPKFYQPNNQPSQINGAMEAFEALNLATINVFSLGMLGLGGFLFAFDISSLDDVRRNVRRKLGVDVAGTQTDQEGEEEIEKLFASIMDQKLIKGLRGKADTEVKVAKEAKEVKENAEKS